MQKTYKGSCHCGAVRFEADIDLRRGTNKCNCTLCTKFRNWNAIIQPSAFRLLRGDGQLTDYKPVPKAGPYLFCSQCGIRTFHRGYHEAIGGDFIAVQLASLDNVTTRELIDAPVRYSDGLHNDWDHAPEEIRHL